jgi:hypothetical protein
MEQILINKINTLPEEIREYVLSPQIASHIQHALRPYDLDVKEKEAIFEEVIMFICGFSHPNDFGSHLALAGLLTEEEGESLSATLFEHALSPILEPLFDLWYTEFEDIFSKTDPLQSINLDSDQNSMQQPNTPFSPDTSVSKRDLASQALTSSIKTPRQTRQMSDDDMHRARKGLMNKNTR